MEVYFSGRLCVRTDLLFLTERLVLAGGAVHLGDLHLLVLRVLLAQVVPGRRETLAVSAPAHAHKNGHAGFSLFACSSNKRTWIQERPLALCPPSKIRSVTSLECFQNNNDPTNRTRQMSDCFILVQQDDQYSQRSARNTHQGA